MTAQYELPSIGPASLVVAASDALARIKARADYICDGTAADANAAGVYSARNGSYDGEYMREGGKLVAADGNLTVTSSTDQSSSSFVGAAWVMYVPGI